MSNSTKLILQWASIVIGVGLLLVSVTAWFDGGAGRLPSAIAMGACGWLLVPVVLAFGRCKKDGAKIGASAECSKQN